MAPKAVTNKTKDMAIYNLTGRNYSSLITKKFKETVYKCFNVVIRHGLGFWRLEEIPVFLVEATQSQSMVSIHRSQYAIRVPKDKWEGMSEATPEESLYDLLRLRELQEYLENEKKPDPKKKKNVRHISIIDYLGVYMSDNDPIAPNRIFVWVDKICKCANGEFDNESALLMQVILHELTHAFMEVSFMSDNRHNTLFTYNHPAYRFIEEAIANGLSLHMCMPILTTKQQLFLEQFVLNQGRGYSEGVPIFKSYPLLYVTRISIEWRWSKSFFNKDIAGVIYKALLCINLNSGLWLRPLGSGLRDVHTNIIRAQRNNTVNTTNTSKV
jgi:hypothetical protein